jgi:phospho-N-acetylmuramoyl-pentapeptide-transferase
MLYHLLVPLANQHIVFNVFRYLTFRSVMALITALVISLVVGPPLIAWLRRRQHGGDTIREDTPERHQTKKGTPTMGGLVILIALLGSTLLWGSLTNRYVWVVVLATLGFGLIGYWDDRRKLQKRKGLSARAKFGLQLLLTLALLQIVFWQPAANGWAPVLAIPFLKGWLVNLGWWWFLVALLVIVGASNAVNLTDGLDGLAIGPIIMAGGAFAVIAYLTGNFRAADYLKILNVRGAGELTVFCGALIGAAIGFLWFNCHPAQVFMGDVGSLALGGAIGTLAVLTKAELLLPLIGGLYVVEAASVIIQVASFKLTGRRVFRMAPLHHHYELAGWAEPKIVIRFWIVSFALALLALSTLKLR